MRKNKKLRSPAFGKMKGGFGLIEPSQGAHVKTRDGARQSRVKLMTDRRNRNLDGLQDNRYFGCREGISSAFPYGPQISDRLRCYPPKVRFRGSTIGWLIGQE